MGTTIDGARCAAVPDRAAGVRGAVGALAFLRTPWPCRAWVSAAVVAALVLPVALAPLGHRSSTGPDVLTGVVLVTLSVLNVEIARYLEGGVSAGQRPHKALSAWSFATALLLPTWWLLPVVAVAYTHARWRGLRVPLWKWVGSAAYIVLAGLAAGVTSAAILDGADLMAGDGSRGVVTLLTAAAAFMAVATVLFHGSAYLNEASDEAWLRQTLRSRSFYVTEVGVLLIGGLSAALWSGGRWFVLLLLPVYAVAQRAALHEPLRERADHDDKTGLLRFESWRRLAMAGTDRCRRRGDRPWSVLFADLDHFKRFNDHWGHLAGDEALVEVARVLSAQLRDEDLIARFGGEEFCVFLPGIGAEDAAAIAERMRAAVRAIDQPVRQRLTISVGVATVEGPGEDVEFVQALTAADKGLIEAKRAGRDCVRTQVLSQPA